MIIIYCVISITTITTTISIIIGTWWKYCFTTIIITISISIIIGTYWKYCCTSTITTISIITTITTTISIIIGTWWRYCCTSTITTITIIFYYNVINNNKILRHRRYRKIYLSWNPTS